MMKKFKVIIPCIVYKTYEVEAPSAEEAEEMVYSTGAEPIHAEYCDDGVAEVEETE
tara:strand:- start:193 stop:360 length:168 start_codon:yes stop_codon:yes gene_type:complete